MIPINAAYWTKIANDNDRGIYICENRCTESRQGSIVTRENSEKKNIDLRLTRTPNLLGSGKYGVNTLSIIYIRKDSMSNASVSSKIRDSLCTFFGTSGL